MAYRHHETVRFHHVDAARILYFSRVFELCHSAMESMMNDSERPFATFFEDPEFLLPIVHAEADYRRPMMLGDAVAIDVTIAEGGESSLAFAFVLTGADGKVRAQARHVHACVDAQTFRKRAIPPDFVALMRKQTEGA